MVGREQEQESQPSRTNDDQTSKQAGPASEQPTKQPTKQTNNQPNNQTSKQPNIQTKQHAKQNQTTHPKLRTFIGRPYTTLLASRSMQNSAAPGSKKYTNAVRSPLPSFFREMICTVSTGATVGGGGEGVGGKVSERGGAGCFSLPPSSLLACLLARSHAHSHSRCTERTHCKQFHQQLLGNLW